MPRRAQIAAANTGAAMAMIRNGQTRQLSPISSSSRKPAGEVSSSPAASTAKAPKIAGAAARAGPGRAPGRPMRKVSENPQAARARV